MLRFKIQSWRCGLVVVLRRPWVYSSASSDPESSPTAVFGPNPKWSQAKIKSIL